MFNLIDCKLDTTKEIFISSLHEETENESDQANSDPTVQVQIVSISPNIFTTKTISRDFHINNNH